MLPSMPRQILTIELDGLTAGDYIAHVADPEPPALGRGLRSVTLRAQPLDRTVEALLVWDEAAPGACEAATAAGLPFVAEAVRIEATEIHDVPVERRPERTKKPAPKLSRLSALTERAALRLAHQARPATFSPQVLRWA
jgi:hypothetical protein